MPMSSPSTHTRPASMDSSSLMQRSRVDLPEPEGPMSTVTEPGSTVRSTPRSTCSSSKNLCRPAMQTLVDSARARISGSVGAMLMG